MNLLFCLFSPQLINQSVISLKSVRVLIVSMFPLDKIVYKNRKYFAYMEIKFVAKTAFQRCRCHICSNEVRLKREL